MAIGLYSSIVLMVIDNMDSGREQIYRNQMIEILELMQYAVEMGKDVSPFIDVLMIFSKDDRPLTTCCFREFVSRYKNDGVVSFMMFYQSRCYQ